MTCALCEYFICLCNLQTNKTPETRVNCHSKNNGKIRYNKHSIINDVAVFLVFFRLVVYASVYLLLTRSIVWNHQDWKSDFRMHKFGSVN